MGASGRGKSTLSASFARSGLTLMGDDAMVLAWVDGQPCANAVYPSLRLFPDSIDALYQNSIDTSEVASDTPKRRIELPIGDHDHAAPVPIKALYQIGRPALDDSISLRPMSIAETCMAIVENSFALDPSDTARAKVRLGQASELARQTVAFEIIYPRVYDRLPDVRQAILEQMASIS